MAGAGYLVTKLYWMPCDGVLYNPSRQRSQPVSPNEA